MDIRSRIPYYYALFLFCTHVVAEKALPPKNVNLLCHNMSNTLSWEHDEAGPGLSFEVEVRSLQSAPVKLGVNWPDMSIDLSKYSNPTDDYRVKVFAVKDGNITSKSEPTPSLSYSYFQDSLAKQICRLDLPMVAVEALEENHLHFSFTHPAVLYLQQETTRKRRNYESQSQLPDFEYHIEILGQEGTYDFTCNERECQDSLRVDSSEKSYCLNISGEMEKMSVQGTRKYCSKPLKAAGINPAAVIIPIVLVLVGGVVIGAMLFVRKTKPSPSTSRPTALDVSGSSRPQQNPTQAEYCRISVGDSSPDPLITPEQDTSNNNKTLTDDLHLPLGVPDAENENEQEQEAGEQGAPGDGYRTGNDLDRDGEEEEEQPSAYEPSMNEPSAYERR